MANLENTEKVCGIVRSPTWNANTAVTEAYDGDFTYTATKTQSAGVDVNSKFQSYLRTVDESVGVTLSGPMTYDGSWLHALYGVHRFEAPGTGTAPTEQTPLQNDYLHEWDGTGTPSEIPFYTMAWQVNSDVNGLIPSVQFQSATLNFPVNAPANYSIQGVGNRLTTVTNTGGVNGRDELNTLASAGRQAYTQILMGPASNNSYFRLGATSAALDANDSMPVTNVSITLNRSETSFRTTSGSTSRWIQQPCETGRVTATMSVTFNQEEIGGYDAFSNWISQVIETDHSYQAELQVTGAGVASGLRRRFVMQFPFLNLSAERPSEYQRVEDVLSSPTVNFTVMQAPASVGTPTGMAANTPSIQILNQRSTGYST